MASKKAYKKALRAAKSVVAGRKQSASAALAGLALVAYLPACTSSNPDPEPVDSGSDVTTLLDTSSGDVQQVLSDIHDMLSTDIPMPKDESTPLPEITASDEGPAPIDEGPAPTDEGPVPTDEGPAPSDEGPVLTDEGPAPTDEGVATDVVVTWQTNFPETCMQPTGESCTVPEDCSDFMPICIEGVCLQGSTISTLTGQSCTQTSECGENEFCLIDQCIGHSELSLLADQCCDDALDEKGCLQATDTPCSDAEDCGEFGGMECYDGQCHVTQLSSNHPLLNDVNECCVAWNFLQGCSTGQYYPMGCYPWGPPAPPAYDGVRLKDLLYAEVA